MVAQIRTVDELEALQKDPVQYASYLTEVIAEKMPGAIESQVESVVKRHLAKASLPSMSDLSETRAVAREAVGDFVKGFRTHDSWKKWGKLSPATKEYGGDRAGGYGGLNEWLSEIADVRFGKGFAPRLKASLAEGQGSTGGFLVPEEYRMQLMALALELAAIRPRAMIMPMTGMTLNMPIIRDTSHATSVFGGVTAYWEPEAGTMTESEPTFSMMRLMAHKLTGYTVASNEVLADAAVALEALISQRFPQAITWFEEKAFWTGIGGGEPLGILNAPATISVSRQTASHIVYEDIVNMDSQILPMSAGNVVWFAHPKCKQDLYTMALSVGTGGGPVFINSFNGGAANTPPATIFGRPLIFTEHLSALGTAGDLVAADLSYYIIGDRQDLAMEASPHVKFTTDQTVYRFVERLDARPWIDSALTLADGSFQVSPFVKLS